MTVLFGCQSVIIPGAIDEALARGAIIEGVAVV